MRPLIRQFIAWALLFASSAAFPLPQSPQRSTDACLAAPARQIGLVAASSTDQSDAVNPAAVPEPRTPQIWAQRWHEKLARVRKGDVDLIFVGDSITHAWDNPENYPVWSAYYEARKAVDLGYSGARTENILWMLRNGEVDGIAPKVAVVLIGTNNADGKHFPTASTPEQIAGGIAAIVCTLREKLPTTKILLLRIFPRADLPGAADICAKASAIASRLADRRMVFYLDINHIFLRRDGTVDSALMPDRLHPNAVGNLLWAQAMEPALSRLMGKPANTATVPAPRCEGLVFDWEARHEAAKEAIRKHPPDLIFVGDSITHLFGGEPTSNLETGGTTWDRYYGARHAVNLGFGWDRTQQAIWRLKNGELEGIHPKVAVVMIGTNNLTPHAARGNTDEEIAAGVREVCETIHHKSPTTRILLLAIFPRGWRPDDLFRIRIVDINRQLHRLNGRDNITFLDIGSTFLSSDGTISPDIMPDYLHPNAKGYGLWAAAMEPKLAELMGERSAATVGAAAP